MTQSLPTNANGLTAEWISQALDARHPGVRVAGVELLDQTAGTNHHVRLGLTYHAQAGAPDTMFCKMAPLDAAHRQAIGATGMGAREARFYSELAPSIGMRVPLAHFAAAEPDGAFLLLLEDLGAVGCRISDGTWGVPADLAAGALADLAELHARFEDADHLAAVAPWVSTVQPGATEFTVGTLRYVIDTFGDQLSDAYVAVAEIYIADHAAVRALWDIGPHTLIHGDAHIGNLFIDNGRVGFLDWGLLTVTTPMRDVSYFLTMGMDPDERRSHERELVQHYLDVHGTLGGHEISFDDAWMAHRVHAGYTVLASFLSLVPPYNSAEFSVFSNAFRSRAMAALDDLDTVTALRGQLAP